MTVVTVRCLYAYIWWRNPIVLVQLIPELTRLAQICQAAGIEGTAKQEYGILATLSTMLFLYLVLLLATHAITVAVLALRRRVPPSRPSRRLWRHPTSRPRSWPPDPAPARR